MAALRGFDSFVASAVATPPHGSGDVLLSVALPARVTVGGIDLSVGDLDANAAPTLSLNIGDAALQTRFVAGSSIARDGGLLEYRPESVEYYRYNLAANVLVRVAAPAATGATGTIAATIYGYLSLDISEAEKMVLQALGVLAEGETPRAEDAVLARGALVEVHEQFRFKALANRQDLAWPVTLLPSFAGRPYARMAADLLSDTFGLSAQRAQMGAARAKEAEREMRRQTQVKSTGKPVSLNPYKESPDYFLDEGILA
jgi:hypothetical protein